MILLCSENMHCIINAATVERTSSEILEFLQIRVMHLTRRIQQRPQNTTTTGGSVTLSYLPKNLRGL